MPAALPASAAEVLDALAAILEQESAALAPSAAMAEPDERPGAGEPTMVALRAGSAPAVSIPTLRHRAAAFHAAAEAAFPRGDVPESLRALLARFDGSVQRLQSLEDDRRGVLIELTERERRHQRERDDLLTELRQIRVEHEGLVGKLRALEGRRDAVQANLDAIDQHTRGAAHGLQRRAVSVGAEIADELAAIDEDGDEAKGLLRSHPVAHGLLLALERPSSAPG